jgi:hypothetical protein
MAYDGAGSLFARGLRLTKLNADGSPTTGANNCYVTDALVKITFGLNYSSPNAVSQNNGSGITCVYYQPPPSLQGGTIGELTVCTPDPHILEFCCGGHVISSGGTNEVQTITVTGTPTGGSFTLTFNGQTTAAIAYNAAAAAVKTALEALTNIAVGDVTTSGGPLPTTAVTVTFAGAYASSDVPQMTATASFTGGTSPAVAVTTTTPGVIGTTTIGYQAPAVNVDPTPNGVAIEAWGNGILNNATPASLPYFQWVAPRAKLTPSDVFSLEEANFTTPKLAGTLTENELFADGPVGDVTFPTNRVWQFARVASIPTLTPGFITVT